MSSQPLGSFAESVFRSKYSLNGRETWNECAKRVAQSIMNPLLKRQQISPILIIKMEAAIAARKFLPAGRYLYAAGRKYQAISNCFLLRADDSREGWANLTDRCINALMSGGGVGVDYSPVRGKNLVVKGLGGLSTGPCALMQIQNEAGRQVRQGGSRRSAIWAGLLWSHPDIFDFIRLKHWPEWMARAKRENFDNPATMDMTNISVILNTEFFLAFGDPTHSKHDLAVKVFWASLESGLRTGDPGFSIDCGINEGENLRNAPIAGETKVLTDKGYELVSVIADEPTTVWTGKQWAKNVVFHKTGFNKSTLIVHMTGRRKIRCEPWHEFILEDGSRVPAADLQIGDSLLVELPKPESPLFNKAEYARMYALGFVHGDGSFTSGSQGWFGDLTLCTPDKQAAFNGILPLLKNVIEYHENRGYKRYKIDFDWLDEFPSKMNPLRGWEQTTENVSAFIAGLFDADGNWYAPQNRLRLASVNFNFLAEIQRWLETLGIMSHINSGPECGFSGNESWMLVVAAEHITRFCEMIPTRRLKPSPHIAYRKSKIKVVAIETGKPCDVYCADVGVPEHSFCAEGVIISNCTEVTSRYDNDNCNLGSLNLARIDTFDEFCELLDLSIQFLIAGSIVGDLPTEATRSVREQHRRIGLGLMGVHEWLLKRGKRYGPDSELRRWMEQYATSTAIAHEYCDKWSINRCIKTRALAPNGTIGIIGETTTCMEPVFAVALKRRWLKGGEWHASFIIDATAKRLIQAGINPDDIETSYSLSYDVERRIAFQAWMQQFVDHAISSTINLPPTKLDTATFGATLMKYLPSLRGITMYPDGARGGQPLVPVPYRDAVSWEGVEIKEMGEEQCPSGVCGM